MTKKAKKRRFDETESNKEEQNVKNNKKVDNDSPEKKKKVSDDLPNAKENELKVSKDLHETNLLVYKSKKKKNKKHKKHDKLDGAESDLSQSESKKKKKNKKDIKYEKNNSVERKIQDSECTSKLNKKHKKIDETETKGQCTTSVSKKHEKIEAVKLINQDGETINKSKKKHENIEAVETKNQDAESTNKSKKKKKNKHKKHKQADKLVEKLESNSDKSDNKSAAKVEKVINTKRKTKFKLKREEFRKQRKLIRQEEGQFSSINKLSLEEMKQKISEIESRESLSNSALRKLRTLKKKVQVEEENAVNVKTDKRKNDELDEHTKEHKNKKIKKEELLPSTTKSIDSPSKNKKEVTPKKSKNVEHNLTEQITNKQLFIKDREGSTAIEDKQEKLQLKPTKKELFIEDKIGIPLSKSRIDSPQKKHEKLEIMMSKNKKFDIGNVDFEDGSYDDSHQIQVLDNVHSKKVEIKQYKSPELKKINKKKLKSEIIVNLGKEERDLEESDSKIDSNKESNQISLKKEITASNKESPKKLKHHKNNKNKFEQKISDKEDGELEDDSDDSGYSKSNSISFTKKLFTFMSLQKEIKANNQSLSHMNIQNKKKKTVEQKCSDMEEGELAESDAEDSSSYETNDISLKKEIRANNKELPGNLKTEKKIKKFEQKSSDVEEGELEENDSEESDLEDSDSEDSTYSDSDDISLKKEQIINQKESLQNLKNQKKKNKKFEPKSDKEEGELEEGDETKIQSDNTPILQVEHSLKQKENHNNANFAKKQRYVLFLGNLAYETTTVDLKKHFLTKVNKVKDVRIPLDAKTRKPRGFGYIEVENSEDYEKALSLHGTFVKGRPIKVQYTASGSKKAGNKKEIIHKNKKLHALRKAGKLAGSKKDSHKRSFRRNFKKERTQK